MAEINVALVDGHVMVREALVGHLEREEDIQVVAHFGSGAQLLDYLSSRAGPVPHVVVLALWLQDTGGIVTAHRLHQQTRHIQIIGLTDIPDPEIAKRMQAAGAYGCVHKSYRLSALLDIIRAARYGGDREDPTTKKIVSDFDLKHDAFPTRTGLPADHPQEKPDLTLREFDVLQSLCRAYSNYEIGLHLGISNRTVQTHLTHIYRKMRVRGRNEAIIKAVYHRWVFPTLFDTWEAG